MSEFYGTLDGRTGNPATRCGSKGSGIRATVETWLSIIETSFSMDVGKKHRAQLTILTKDGNYSGLSCSIDADAIAVNRHDDRVSDAIDEVHLAIERLNFAAAEAETGLSINRLQQLRDWKESDSPLGPLEEAELEELERQLEES